jgi:hypothetical protein
MGVKQLRLHGISFGQIGVHYSIQKIAKIEPLNPNLEQRTTMRKRGKSSGAPH